MPTSIKRRVAHLQEIVGENGDAECIRPGRPDQHFTVKCRLCRDPNPHNPGAQPAKRLVARAPFVKDAAYQWLTHEAAHSHDPTTC